MNQPHITLTGHIAAPPTLRLAAGVPVTSFRVGTTPRKVDKATDTWSDGETLWFTVTAWRGLAEHCASSLVKGDKVVVTGRLTQRTWKPEDGEARAGLEIDAATVGLDLSRSSAVATRRSAPGRQADDGAEAARGEQQPVDDGADDWDSDGSVDRETGEVGIRAVLPEPIAV